MAIIRASGKPNVEYFPSTTSTLLYENGVVALTSGKLVMATGTSTAHVGVLLQRVATTDVPYTTSTMLPIDVPMSSDLYYADVKPGVTFAATSVGVECDLFVGTGTTGALGEQYVDTGTNSHHQVLIVGFVSSTRAIVKLTSMNSYNNPAAA